MQLRASARENSSAPPNAAGEGFCSSTYKHATPNGVKPVNASFTAQVTGGGIDDLINRTAQLGPRNPHI